MEEISQQTEALKESKARLIQAKIREFLKKKKLRSQINSIGLIDSDKNIINNIDETELQKEVILPF